MYVKEVDEENQRLERMRDAGRDVHSLDYQVGSRCAFDLLLQSDSHGILSFR